MIRLPIKCSLYGVYLCWSKRSGILSLKCGAFLSIGEPLAKWRKGRILRRPLADRREHEIGRIEQFRIQERMGEKAATLYQGSESSKKIDNLMCHARIREIWDIYISLNLRYVKYVWNHYQY